MIQENVQSNIISSSALQQTTCTIESNAYMFDMLISKVYNDPIKAVIREWSTNALDACLAADLPPMFDVHLPVDVEPYFHVRDFGTGLSDSDIQSLYTTIGASTKRDSNDYNGTFGIGRLSGLAYASSFNIDSYYNGTHTSYLFTINNGIPLITTLLSIPTDEPNGLKLTIQVQPKDFDKFIGTASYLYSVFSTKPTTNIPVNYSYTFDIETDTYAIPKEAMYRPHVLMANVLYEITSYYFLDLPTTQLIFKVPTGAVSITPGRESLSLDNATKIYLEQCAMEYKATVKQDIINLLLNPAVSATEKCTALLHTRHLRSDADITVSFPASLRAYIEPRYLSFYSDVPDRFTLGILWNNRSKPDFRDISFESVQKFKLPVLILDIKTNFVAAYDLHRGDVSSSFFVLKRNNNTIEEMVPHAIEFCELFDFEYVLASTLATPTERATYVSTRTALIYGSNCEREGLTKSYELTNQEYWFIPANGSSPDLDFDLYRSLSYAYTLIPEDQRKPFVAIPKKYIKATVDNPNFIDATTIIPSIISTLTFELETDLNFYPSSLRPKRLPADLANLYSVYDAYRACTKLPRSTYNIVTKHIPLTTHTYAFAEPVDTVLARYPLFSDIDGIWKLSEDKLQHYIDLEVQRHATLASSG